MSEIIELYSENITSFKYHIDDEENYRTIFTGKFGSGKTMFLKHFFNNQTSTIGNEKYYPIHIFPVNYSISGNEDIIKFIKYDIVTHLLLNQGIDVKGSIDLKTVSGRFLFKNIDRIIASLFLFIPTWGGQALEAFNIFKGLVNEFKDFENSDEDEISKFIDKVQADVKSTFEEDFITSLIQKACAELKKGGKKVVVIIDDLDRIDPDHIFRILNVFAAHFDFDGKLESPNKYGFEKLILVGDIQNIRNIFKSKFGGDTDFNGYIDKFYSKNIFQFDNKHVLKLFWKNIVSNINFSNSNKHDTKHYNEVLKSSYNLPIIEKFIALNFINTRQIFKYYKRNFNIIENKTITLKGRMFPHYFCNTALFLYFLRSLFNSTQDFRDQILKTKFTLDQSDTNMPEFCSELSVINYLINENSDRTPDRTEKTTIRFPQNEYECHVNIYFAANHIETNTFSFRKMGVNRTLETKELPVGELLLIAVDSLNTLNYFDI
jgi:hypothetical protein